RRVPLVLILVALPDQRDKIPLAGALVARSRPGAASRLALYGLVDDLNLRHPLETGSQTARRLAPPVDHDAELVHPEVGVFGHGKRHPEATTAQRSDGQVVVTDVGMVAGDVNRRATGNETILGVQLEVHALRAAGDRLYLSGALEVCGVVVEVLGRRRRRGPGAASTRSCASKREALDLERTRDLAGQLNRGAVTTVALDRLTDEPVVDINEACPVVEERSDLFLKADRCIGLDQLGPVRGEQRRPDLDRKRIALDDDQHTVVELLQPRAKSEVLRVPVGMDLPVGRQKQR